MSNIEFFFDKCYYVMFLHNIPFTFIFNLLGLQEIEYPPLEFSNYSTTPEIMMLKNTGSFRLILFLFMDFAFEKGMC